MFERVTPAVRRKDGTYETSSCIGSFEDDERMPVYYDGCRDAPENRQKQEQGSGLQNGGWTLGLGDQKTVTLDNATHSCFIGAACRERHNALST